MRKVIFISAIMAVLMILSGFTASKDNLKINTQNITKITVTTGGNKTLKITKNKDKIKDIVNYINGLNFKKTSANVSHYNGLAYVITFYFTDKTSKEYVHYGNKFFRESGKKWYEIPYKQAVKFESIYKSLGSK